MDRQTYAVHFAQRNRDLVLAADGVEVFSIIEAPLSPNASLIFATAQFDKPLACPSGKRHMTHVTEAVLCQAPTAPGNPPTIRARALTYCSSADTFDLAVGEKTALTRLLAIISVRNPDLFTKEHKTKAWEAYLAERQREDDLVFEAVMATARKEKAAEEARAQAQAAAAAWRAKQQTLIEQQQLQQLKAAFQGNLESLVRDLINVGPFAVRPRLAQNPLATPILGPFSEGR